MLFKKQAYLIRGSTVLSLPPQLVFPGAGAAICLWLIVFHCCKQEYQRVKYHYTVDLLFDSFGISCMTTDNIYFYLQNRLIQPTLTGGQSYSPPSPFSIPWLQPWPPFKGSSVRVRIEKIFAVTNALAYYAPL